MKIFGDYHLHTYASDGRATVREHFDRAAALGISEIAITDHSFCSLVCCQTEEKFAAQRREIDELSGHGVRILQGVEANILGEDGKIDVPDEIIRRCDILLAGFHRFLALTAVNSATRYVLVNGFLAEPFKQNMVDINTRSFINAINKYPIDVISHLGHRTPVNYGEVARAAKTRGVYIELNEKHILDTHGIVKAIGDIVDSGVNFIVGTDAHSAKKLGDFGAVEKFVVKYGIPHDRIFGIDGNAPTFKDKAGWKNEL